jgi:hypothetical protein
MLLKSFPCCFISYGGETMLVNYQGECQIKFNEIIQSEPLSINCPVTLAFIICILRIDTQFFKNFI